MKRELTDDEKQFVKEAEAGGFMLDYEDDGRPVAYGAHDTDNLFTVDVQQERVGVDESLYYLRGSTNEE